MEFTPRIRDILWILLEAKEPIGKQEIADRLKISKRTAQREFDYIHIAIREYHLEIEQIKGSGVRLVGKESDLNALKEKIQGANVIGSNNKEDRLHKITFLLLKDPSPKKLMYFSDILKVSEATVASDIESLKPWAKKNNLSLVKRQGYGVVLEGSEKNLRKAMRRFIAENGVSDLFEWNRNADISQAMMDSLHQNHIYSLLNRDTVDRVHHILQNMNEPVILGLADNAYMGLIIHISIAVERICSGAQLSADKNSDMESMKVMDEYALAKRILKDVEDEFKIIMPESEVSYLMLHLLGSKVAFTNQSTYETTNFSYLTQKDLYNLVEIMTIAYDPNLADEYLKDEEFVHSLMMHLRPVLLRLENQLDIFNPILEDMKKEYSQVFQKSQKAAQVISKYTHKEVSEDEVGFLAMHYGAMEEKLQQEKPRKRKVKIGVVCASGFGLAQLMIVRLQEYLKDDAELMSYGRGEIKPAIRNYIDFFVSSFDLSKEEVDFVKVSPLITQNDLQMIQLKIQQYASIEIHDSKQDFMKQLEIVEYTSKEIRNLIEGYRHLEVSKDLNFDQLLWSLSMNVAKNLENAKIIKEDLIRREKMGGLVFEDIGIVLLHCISAGIEKPVFITCTPRDTKKGFENAYFQGVRLVTLLLMPKDLYIDHNKEILGYISASFIQEPKFLQVCQNGEEELIRQMLIERMRKYLYELMMNFEK